MINYMHNFSCQGKFIINIQEKILLNGGNNIMGNGFLKQTSEFRSNVNNGQYLPILNSLLPIASMHHDNLPTFFSVDDVYSFSEKDVEYVLSQLYPNRKYSCQRVNSSIFCVRSN